MGDGMSEAVPLPPIVLSREAEWASIAYGESPQAFAVSTIERRLAETGTSLRGGKRRRLESVLAGLAERLFAVGAAGGLFYLPDPTQLPVLAVRLITIGGADVSREEGERDFAFPADWYLLPPNRLEIETPLGTAVRTVHRIANQDLGGEIGDVVRVIWWFDGVGGWGLTTQIRDLESTPVLVAAIDRLAAGAEPQ